MDSIITLTENDILMGRGGNNRKHSGNERLRMICHYGVQSYKVASKKEKYIVTTQILQLIRSLEPEGRFLEFHAKENTWHETTEKRAREKVSQCFRDAIYREKHASQKVLEYPQYYSFAHRKHDQSSFENKLNARHCLHPMQCNQITTVRVSPTDSCSNSSTALRNFTGADFLVSCEVSSDSIYKCKQFELTNIPVPSNQHYNIDMSESIIEELNEDTHNGSTMSRSNDYDSLPSNLEEYLESLDDCDISLSSN